ncbi:MAG TPA: type IV pilus biogenesis/stability protein PilW [Methylophilaceae bacterium]|nr:type IV pilus biogenesis/stability protein PilW [Methylophilaceae bacterium]HQR60811.1 type IV pilus biogenesis/stability protein PilW [Methylophilaceae bacterium]
MKKPLLLLWMVVALAGCVTERVNPYNVSKQETSARNRAKVHTELASGYYARGMQAVALEEFSEAISIDPEYAPAYGGLGLVYTALNEEAKAESNYRKSLQLDPTNSDMHNNYGAFLCARNRIDESISEFKLALKNPLYDTPEMAYLNAARCVLKKGDDSAAETYLLRALELRPGMCQASYQLAQIAYGRAEYARAREEFNQSTRCAEPTAEMLWLGVRIERALGDAGAEASYGMLLKNKYPKSEQAKAYLSGQK